MVGNTKIIRNSEVRIRIYQFNKPTHETGGRYYINLQVEKVENAKKNKEHIIIKLPQGFCEPVNPSTLLKHGTRTEAVYKFENNPMRLVGAYYQLFSEGLQERIKYDPYFFENL